MNSNFFKKITIRTTTLLALLIISLTCGYAQTITGILFEKDSGEPLSFANITVKGTDIGTASELDGSFILDVPDAKGKTLVFDFIGFKSKEITIKETFNFEVFLEADNHTLGEVTVRPDYSYDKEMFKKVIANKSKNNPSQLNEVSYLDYSRLSIFLNNLDKKITERRIFKNSVDAFISKSDSTVMMPFFMSETLLEKRYDGKWEEKILAEESECLLDKLDKTVNNVILEKLASQINFYNNRVLVMDKGFPSPLSKRALLLYNIYLTDSTTVDGSKHYKFDFYPKNRRNTTFKGHFWVEDGSFALSKIVAKLPNSANINYVNNFEVSTTYAKTQENVWFYKQQKIKLDFTLVKSKDSTDQKKEFAIQKIVDFQQVNTNAAQEMDLSFIEKNATSISQDAPSLIYGLRSQPLDLFEQQAYDGIKKLKDERAIKMVDKLGEMFLTSYYHAGYIDIGSFFDIYQRNAIEGHRLTLPFRTSEKLAKNISLNGFVGYGTKSKEVKYGGAINFRLPTDGWTIFSLRYEDDYFELSRSRFHEFIKENPFTKGNGNLLNAFSASPTQNIIRQKKWSLNIEHQLHPNIGLIVRPFYKEFEANNFINFVKGDIQTSSFKNVGILLDARISFSQKFQKGYFSRVYYGNQKPILHFTAEFGKNIIPNTPEQKDKYYTHLNLSIRHKVNIGQAKLRTLLQTGYIKNDVPFPLLHMPRGNQSIGYARFHYNLLKQTSIASDLYTDLHLELNGGGTVLNNIPLISRLKLRETLTFKGHYGKLLGNHQDIFELPNSILTPPNRPYLEMGIGVTNLFKVLRLEYVRRLTNGEYMDKISAQHGVRFRIEVAF